MLSTMTIFFKTSEHTVRGMTGYSGKFHSMVSIFLHDCKEPDMVWAFLTKTATKYRELALTSPAQSSYRPILVWSKDIAFAHAKLMQFHDTGSEICDFRRCTKRWWFMEPAGSHTSAPPELWAYLKCFHVLVMKIKLSPHKFRASMPF